MANAFEHWVHLYGLASRIWICVWSWRSAFELNIYNWKINGNFICFIIHDYHKKRQQIYLSNIGKLNWPTVVTGVKIIIRTVFKIFQLRLWPWHRRLNNNKARQFDAKTIKYAWKYNNFANNSVLRSPKSIVNAPKMPINFQRRTNNVRIYCRFEMKLNLTANLCKN